MRDMKKRSILSEIAENKIDFEASRKIIEEILKERLFLLQTILDFNKGNDFILKLRNKEEMKNECISAERIRSWIEFCLEFQDSSG